MSNVPYWIQLFVSAQDLRQLRTVRFAVKENMLRIWALIEIGRTISKSISKELEQKFYADLPQVPENSRNSL